jgi:hypothetical protein
MATTTVPKFSDIVKDPEFGQLTDVERQQVADRYFLNVVNKDPEFGQMNEDEQKQVYNRLYQTAGLGEVQLNTSANTPPGSQPVQAELDMEDPSLKPQRQPLQGQVKKTVTWQEGLSNIAEAAGQGLTDVGQGLVNPQTYTSLANQAGQNLMAESQHRIEDMQQRPLETLAKKAIGGPAGDVLPGAVEGLRKLAQGVYNFPGDVINAWNGQEVLERTEIPQFPWIKEQVERYPVNGFIGEQLPYALPALRMARVGEAAKAKGIIDSALEAGTIGALIDPGKEGLRGRVANDAAAMGLTAAGGTLAGGLTRRLPREQTIPRLQGRVEMLNPKTAAGDLTVQELSALHPLDTAVPNGINPITGKSYPREMIGGARESAQAIKQGFSDIKTAESIYKESLRDYETKVGTALQKTGTGDIAEAHRMLGQRINELEPKANTGMMTEAEATELMDLRDTLDGLLQSGKSLSDASDLLQEVRTPMQREAMGAEGGLEIRQDSPGMERGSTAPEMQARDMLKPDTGAAPVAPEQTRPAQAVAMEQPAKVDMLSGTHGTVEPSPAPIELNPAPVAKPIDILNPEAAPVSVTPGQVAGPRDMLAPQASARQAAALSTSPELDYIFRNNKPISEGLEPTAPASWERGFISTLKDSPNTAPEVKGQLTGEYAPVTNQETLKHAKEMVDADPEAAYKQVMRQEEPTAETYATAQELMRRYQNAGDYESAADIAEVIAERATKQGQAIQALSMWGRLTPEGALVTAERLAKKAGLGESPQAVIKLSDAVERFRNNPNRRVASQIKDFANKSSRASFKKALGKLSQEELDNLGRMLGC